MNNDPSLRVAASFVNVHEAQLARTALEAAGIDATLADEHVVAMNWVYSNAVGGVKVLVSADRLEDARAVLGSPAVVIDEAAADVESGEREVAEVCRRCGGHEFESKVPGKRVAVLSWLTLGVPLGAPLRRRYCRACGAPAQ